MLPLLLQAASSPIPPAGSAHLIDEWVRGEVDSKAKERKAAASRLVSRRRREEAKLIGSKQARARLDRVARLPPCLSLSHSPYQQA